MPIVRIEGVGEIEFPDSMPQMSIESGLSALKIVKKANEAQIAKDVELSKGGVLVDTVMGIPKSIFSGGPSVLDTPEIKQRRKDREIDFIMNLMPGAGITAFHGSPHKFTKFDSSKIGTGEGAQVYGQGLYFAENPATATSYADAVKLPASDKLRSIVGNKYSSDTVDSVADALGSQKTIENAKKVFIRDKKSQINDLTDESFSFLGPNENSKVALEQELRNGLQLFDEVSTRFVFEPQFYKIDIPGKHISKMLDWDKPLSKQSDFVKNALDKVNPDMRDMPGNTGENFYRANTGFFGGAGNLSKKLKEAGIPGIRYLDQGSRQGGKGTSNFVVFDDTIPEILEINGKPIAQKSKDILSEVGAKFVIPTK